MAELNYGDAAASGYERAFAHVTSHFLPGLLRAAGVAPGQRVLDVATGTGLAAEAALALVGPQGHVTATDLSAGMVERARARLSGAANAAVRIEDGQAIDADDGWFDAVICSLGLMFFPDPARGLAGFHRVLRPGGRAAVSVLTTPERSYNGRINVVIARYAPGLTAATARTFSLGTASAIVSMFEAAGFVDVETTVERRAFELPSFDAYYTPFEHGAASTGEALSRLDPEQRAAVREDVRRSLGDVGGPVTIDVEFRLASGRRPESVGRGA